MLESDVSPRAHAFVVVKVHIPEGAECPSIDEAAAALDRDPQRVEFGVNDGVTTHRLHATRTLIYEIPVK